MIGETAPGLLASFRILRAAIGSPDEPVVVDRIDATLPVVSFSDRVLTSGCARLATMRVKDLEWSDWGNPGRVLASLARAERKPSWLGRVALAGTA